MEAMVPLQILVVLVGLLGYTPDQKTAWHLHDLLGFHGLLRNRLATIIKDHEPKH